MEDTTKLLFSVLSPFVTPPSAPPQMNYFDFLPKAIGPDMLNEEKSSQQEK